MSRAFLSSTDSPRLTRYVRWGFALSLVFMFGCAACTPRHVSADDATNIIEKSDITDSVSRLVDSVISVITTEKKAAQFFMPAVYASSDPYTLARIKEYARKGVGGIILLKGDAKSARIIADSMERWSKIPPFIAIDAEWGLAMRLKDTPKFPMNSRIAEDTDEETMFEYGRELARECRRTGINMILGPVLDVTGEESYIGKRSFGNDPERVADFAIAYARGLESGNVASVAKHFPGHGAAKGDSHRRKPSIDRSLQSLDSIDLRPFRRYIEQRLSGIMIGHLAFPAIDPDMLPAAVSKPVIDDLLRTDMGFVGLVLTDAMNMLGAEGYGSDMAISAGADMILAPADTDTEIQKVLDAVGRKKITDAEIDSHLRRILFKKFLLKYDGTQETYDPDNIERDLNSREAARLNEKLNRR